MYTISRIALLSLAASALACGDSDAGREAADRALSPDLRADLELAAAADIELASAARGSDTLLSALERTPRSTPDRARAPRRSPGRRAAAPEPVASSESSETLQESLEPVEAASTTEVAEVGPAPVASPRPVPIPVSYPGTGNGGYEGEGGGIGVVIRGGSTGVDRCERHGGHGGTSVIIDTRTPPVTPTFPGPTRSGPRVEPGTGGGWRTGIAGGSSRMDPRTRAAQPRTRGMEPRTRTIEPRTRTIEPRTRTIEPRTRTIEPRARSIEPRSRTTEPRTRAVTRSTADRSGTKINRPVAALPRG